MISKDGNILQDFVGAFFTWGYACVLLVVLATGSVAKRLRIGDLAAAILLVGVYAVAVALVVVFFHAVIAFERWKSARLPCKHGVRSGARGACDDCKIEKQKAFETNQAEVAGRQRIKDIKKEADALRLDEISRLSKAWLSNSTLYYSMGSRTFEDAVAALFRQLGYAVKQTPYSNDGGKDAILTKDGKTFLVECKRYGESTSVGRPDIQKFVAAMHDESAASGFYVNTGRYSPRGYRVCQTSPDSSVRQTYISESGDEGVSGCRGRKVNGDEMFGLRSNRVFAFRTFGNDRCMPRWTYSYKHRDVRQP